MKVWSLPSCRSPCPPAGRLGRRKRTTHRPRSRESAASASLPCRGRCPDYLSRIFAAQELPTDLGDPRLVERSDLSAQTFWALHSPTRPVVVGRRRGAGVVDGFVAESLDESCAPHPVAVKTVNASTTTAVSRHMSSSRFRSTDRWRRREQWPGAAGAFRSRSQPPQLRRSAPWRFPNALTSSVNRVNANEPAAIGSAPSAAACCSWPSVAPLARSEVASSRACHYVSSTGGVGVHAAGQLENRRVVGGPSRRLAQPRLVRFGRIGARPGACFQGWPGRERPAPAVRVGHARSQIALVRRHSPGRGWFRRGLESVPVSRSRARRVSQQAIVLLHWSGLPFPKAWLPPPSVTPGTASIPRFAFFTRGCASAW